jgi:hypothetical protein
MGKSFEIAGRNAGGSVSGKMTLLTAFAFLVNVRRFRLPSLLIVALLAHPGRSPAQKNLPEPPSDLTRIYYLNADDSLTALPFEPAITSLNVFAPAARDKIERIRIKGPGATTVLHGDGLRFFVFVADRMDPPPHQLVRLSAHSSQRTLAVSVIQGRKGYAPFDNDNIRIERKVIERLQVRAGANRFLFVNYMQLRPLQALPPGEYAIIGDSLADIATFRVN